LNQGLTSLDSINVSRKDREFSGELGNDLGPQQFTLKSRVAGGINTWWVVGGDNVGVLYGAYRFAEKLGVTFSLDGDVIPDAPFGGDFPSLNEIGKPRFALRGLQPFHDFSTATGPNAAPASASSMPDIDAFWSEWGRGMFGGSRAAPGQRRG
jgi:hypothetical protein